MRTRRWLAPLTIAMTLLSACEKAPVSETQTPEGESRRVVLYTSCDDYLLREMIAAFEKETGIDVLEVGDTEATKTVGLYTRLGKKGTKKK